MAEKLNQCDVFNNLIKELTKTKSELVILLTDYLPNKEEEYLDRLSV